MTSPKAERGNVFLSRSRIVYHESFVYYLLTYPLRSAQTLPRFRGSVFSSFLSALERPTHHTRFSTTLQIIGLWTPPFRKLCLRPQTSPRRDPPTHPRRHRGLPTCTRPWDEVSSLSTGWTLTPSLSSFSSLLVPFTPLPPLRPFPDPDLSLLLKFLAREVRGLSWFDRDKSKTW